MQDGFTQLSLWVAQLAPVGTPRALAPFAREVLALEESTQDRLNRWLPALRGLPTGHDGLLPGRLAGLFDVRTQRWRRVDGLPEPQAHGNVHARDMLVGLLPGTLLLFGL